MRLDGSDAVAVVRAAEMLAAGELVAFPTETVYGLGTNADKGSSVTRLLEVTRSPADRRLTLHLSQSWELDRWVRDIPPAIRRLTLKPRVSYRAIAPVLLA